MYTHYLKVNTVNYTEILRHLEQVKQFNYLGCELSLDGEPYFDKEINRFQGIRSTIRKQLKKTVQKHK